MLIGLDCEFLDVVFFPSVNWGCEADCEGFLVGVAFIGVILSSGYDWVRKWLSEADLSSNYGKD